MLFNKILCNFVTRSNPAGEGTARVALQGDIFCFVINTNMEDVVAGHIHKGAAGVDGDVVS